MQLYHGDCLKVMQSIGDATIDCVLTDPPYLTTDLHFDKDGIDIEGLCSSLLRVLKPNGYFISFGSIELLGQLCRYFPIRWTGTWIKPNGVMRTVSAKKPRSQCELYAVMAHPKHKVSELTYNKLKVEGEAYRKVQRTTGGERIQRKDSLARSSPSVWGKDYYCIDNDGYREQTDVIYAPSKNYMSLAERTEHPTQKPVEMLKKLLYMTTNEGDMLLEPFMGSGSTVVACHDLRRNCIGIEKDYRYYQIARERIDNITAQTTIWTLQS